MEFCECDYAQIGSKMRRLDCITFQVMYGGGWIFFERIVERGRVAIEKKVSKF